MGESGPRQMSLPAFVTHCLSLPLLGSPLAFLHPQFLRRSTRSRPHPSEEGRGGCGWDLSSALAGGVGDRAHIPQEMGGAPGRVDVRSLGAN